MFIVLPVSFYSFSKVCDDKLVVILTMHDYLQYFSKILSDSILCLATKNNVKQNSKDKSLILCQCSVDS